MPTLPEFRADRIARLRAKLFDFLPDTCTCARTGATLQVLVEADPGLLTLERGMRVRQYEFTLPASSDVQEGDQLTLSTGEAFLVQQTLVPVSDEVSLRAFAVPTSLRLASYLATEVAAFRTPVLPVRVVSAHIYVLDRLDDIQMLGGGTTPGYRWTVFFESTLAYSDHSLVGDAHHLLLASLFGSDAAGNPRHGIISKPRPVTHGLPFVAAFARELP